MSIATELALLANTKESLRVAIGLSTSVPFSQYAAIMPWSSDVIPATGIVFDFKKNRYAKDGKAVYLDDASEFIRLSSATKWQDGKLVDVQNDIPRISTAGLLVENSATELITDNSTITSTNTAWAATSNPDAQIGNVFEFVSDGSTERISTNIWTYPNGNVSPYSGYYYRSILAKKTSADSFLNLGAGSVNTSTIVNLKNGSLDYAGSYVVESKISEFNEYYLIETLSTETGASARQFRVYASDSRSGTGSTLAVPSIGHKVTLALPSFQDTADFPQSFVKTSGTQVTRSPDTLNIPLLPTQTPTGDWDEGVTYTVSDNIATLAGHGYIRNIVVMLTPLAIFKKGEKGFWIEPDDSSTLFQNVDGTIPVVDGDPIGLVLDKSGNNYNLTQTVSASRPELLSGGIVFDKVDDALTLTVPAGGITGTLFLATTRGTASYNVSMPAGVWSLGNIYNPVGDVVSAVLVDRVLTDDEKARLHVFGVGKGGTEFGVETTFVNAYRAWSHLVNFPLIDTSSVANFNSAWYGCSGLTSFPVLDTSNATNFNSAWYGCSGLTSFPVLDTSNATSLSQTWFNCSNLATFPSNFFDNCLATSFNYAFFNTKLSQASIDGILVSINSNATSNGSFAQSGGSAPSAVGQAAIDAMRARGWTVTTTGGY